MSEPPSIILRAADSVGLFIHYDQNRADEFSECLEADDVPFTLNPPEAAHLAQPGHAVFVFGDRHPRVVAERLKLCGEEVLIDPEMVPPEGQYRPPVDQLLGLGEPEYDEQRNYAALGLSRGDVPALIRMATDDLLHEVPRESLAVWAPVHAWRALVKLRAEEAIVPLTGLFRQLDDRMDDWISEDLPADLAEFGTPALDPLTAFLADASHGDWSRVAAARAIEEVGLEYPELRLDCVGRLAAHLERFAEQSETLNAFFVSSLWNLRAVEAMPVIERAFASGRVDESVMGDVEDVQIHFGLKTKREHPPKPNKLTIMGEKFRAQWKAAGLPLPDADGNWLQSKPEPAAWSPPFQAPLKVGRNEPCPCGSGKKYKKCCGG